MCVRIETGNEKEKEKKDCIDRERGGRNGIEGGPVDLEKKEKKINNIILVLAQAQCLPGAFKT